MRLINAEEAIKEILDVYEYEYPTASGAFDHFVTHMIPNILKNIPTVDAEPVRHGRWKTMPYRSVEHGNVVISGEVEMCTNCRCARKEFHKQMNYCPHCGAKMDEEAK